MTNIQIQGNAKVDRVHIIHFMAFMKIYVAILQETWLSAHERVTDSNFKFTRLDRADGYAQA